MATLKNFTIFRGDNDPDITWTMPFATSGYTFELNVAWNTDAAGGASNDFTVITGSELTQNDSTHVVTWAYTTSESGQIPLGTRATYELRSVLLGAYQTRFYGNITGLGGLTL